MEHVLPSLFHDLSAIFLYTLGGVRMKVATNILLAPATSIPKKFVSPYDPRKDYEISVCINNFLASCAYEPLEGNLIFFQKRTYLARTSEGYRMLFYQSSDEKELLWDARIDQLFSQFEYQLYPAELMLDPWSIVGKLFLLQHSVSHHQGLILHASGGSFKGQGIVFAAPSGGGKSTLSRLLQAYPQNQLFSEERLILRLLDERWQVFGTPWQGSGDIAENAQAPLAALVFLRQAQESSITRLHPSKSLHSLLQVASIPWYSEEWTQKGLSLCETLLQDIPVFELAFRPDQSAVEAVEQLVSSFD